MAFDSDTGNLYGVNSHGNLFGCDTEMNSNTLKCTTLARGTGISTGFALDSAHGQLYWTTFVGLTGSLMRRTANLDSSNVTEVTEVLSIYLAILPAVAVDSSGGRLYVALGDGSGYGIQSCNLDGGDLQLVVQFEAGAIPSGILFHDDRIYWTTVVSSGGKLQSCTKDGKDIRTHYESSERFRHLTIGEDTGDYNNGASEAVKPLLAGTFGSLLVLLGHTDA